MAKQLRSGYTTGACAAAGVKAALLYEAGAAWQEIDLTALDGTLLHIPVKAAGDCRRLRLLVQTLGTAMLP